MSKRVDTKNVTLGEVSTIKHYLIHLKERGIETSKQTIHYQLENTDNLDYCEWQDIKLIVMNNKAKNFTPKGV